MKQFLAAVLTVVFLSLAACTAIPSAPAGTSADISAAEPTVSETQTPDVTDAFSESETEPAAQPSSTTQPPTATQPPTTTQPPTATQPPASEQDPIDNRTDTISYPFRVQSFRSGSESTTYHAAYIIRSRDALISFYSDDLTDNMRLILQEMSPGAETYFDQEIAQYDDAWFADHQLIILRISESSGSYRHEVQSVTRAKNGQVEVAYVRKAPPNGVMTCDMKTTDHCIELETKDLRATDHVSVVRIQP